MEKSLELFLQATIFVQILSIGFALRMSCLVLNGAKLPTALKLWFGFTISFEGFVIILMLGFAEIFDLSLSIHLAAIIAGVLMFTFGRKFNNMAIDEHFHLPGKNPGSS